MPSYQQSYLASLREAYFPSFLRSYLPSHVGACLPSFEHPYPAWLQAASLPSFQQSYSASLLEACHSSSQQPYHPCRAACMDQLRLPPLQMHPQGSCHLQGHLEKRQSQHPWLQVGRYPNQQTQQLRVELRLSCSYPCPRVLLVAMLPAYHRRHQPSHQEA